MSAFSPMPRAEKRRLVVEWNQTGEEFPHTASIHSLFLNRRAAALPLKNRGHLPKMKSGLIVI